MSERDQFGRLLRYVYVGELFVNAELVRQGYIQDSTFPPDVRYQSVFFRLQQEAQEAAMGLWGAPRTAMRIVVRPTATRIVSRRTATPVHGSDCDPNYSLCVPIASDVDCAGGSGNGPAYVRGPVRVIGVDVYDLDRDGDGIGCE